MKMHKPLWLAAVVALGGLVWSGHRSATALAQTAATEARPAMTVTVARPTRDTLPLLLQANGNVGAWQEASVGGEVAGLRLASVRAEVGDRVRRGQVLATFASDSVEAEHQQTRANLMLTEAQMEHARAEAARARSVADTGALSRSQIDLYLTQEKVAVAQWESAKAAHAATALRLRQTQVQAPDDGLISARSATVGAVSGPGQELFRLVRQGRMEWRAELTASEVGRVKAGTRAEVTTAAGLRLSGTVRAVAPVADAQTRNITVYVDLPRHDELKAGTFARGQFQLGQSSALTVPAQAVVVRDGHNHVFVIDATSHKASQRKLVVGRRVGERVEVLSGLKAEEAVAVQGAGFLNEGDLVKVVP